jgi:hypothetical protein
VRFAPEYLVIAAAERYNGRNTAGFPAVFFWTFLQKCGLIVTDMKNWEAHP